MLGCRDSMPLEIKPRESEGIAILELKGSLVLGAEDALMRQTLQSLFDAGKNNLIVDLHEVSKIDTAAAGSLAAGAETVRQRGGRMVLLHVMDSHPKPYEVLKLDTVFETFTDELAAVNSFFPDRSVPHYDLLEFLEEDAEQRHAEKEPSEGR